MILRAATARVYVRTVMRVVSTAAVLTVVAAACTSDDLSLPSTSEAFSVSTTSTEQVAETTTTVVSRVTRTGQSGFVDALGSSDRVCVDVDRIVATEDPVMVGQEEDHPVFDIRSGNILVGNFATLVDQWSTFGPGGMAKVYWVPFDPVTAMAGSLEVVVEPLDREDPSETFTFDTAAFSASGTFWPSGTRFPQPGRYRLTATAPGHWGCFELTV